MLALLLGDAGYTMLVADNESTATRLLREHRGPIDLLLAAATTGPLTGADLAAWAATWRPGLKIILMIAGGQDVALRPGWRRIETPFLVSELREAVTDVLAVRR